MMMSKNDVLNLSLALNVVLALVALFLMVSLSSSSSNNNAWLRSHAVSWHGGHPLDEKSGSCYCSGTDGYCMCTPSLAIDLVIASGPDHVWLVRRKDTNQLATMGAYNVVPCGEYGVLLDFVVVECC